MALKRSLAQRLMNLSKASRPAVGGGYRAGTSPASGNNPQIEPDPRDNGVFRRFLHRRAMAMATPELRRPSPAALPAAGEVLKEQLKSLDVAKGRIRLDGLVPPRAAAAEGRAELTAEDARKLMRVAQLEAVRARLREIREAWMPYTEFVRVCGEAGSDPGRGAELAKLLDESGNVVVFGDMVLLRPDMVMKAMASLIPCPEPRQNDPRRNELEELEKAKSEIDREAGAQVRMELWAGLGLLVVQTAAFMRLTFWELNWDVMEPICFYVTSVYFMAGYAFFLRTSREPSFEGFFNSRFLAKQKKLMKKRNFDIQRYEELRRAFHPPQGINVPPPVTSFADCGFGQLIGAKN